MGRRRAKLPKTPVTADVTSLNHDGRGVTHIDGKVTFISEALPGENVDFLYTNRKQSMDEARAIEIRNPSEMRVTPPCEHFGVCGGCSLQHIGSDGQIKLKQNILLEQFKHFAAGLEPDTVLAPLTASTQAYRRKARLGVRLVHKKGGTLVGFREKYNGRYLADINSCHVLAEPIGQMITPLREFVNSLEARDVIPQLEIAIGDTQAAIILRHLKPLANTDLEAIIQFAQHHNIDMYLQPKGIDTIHKIWPEDKKEFLTYELPDFSLQFQFHPSDFTQVNADINRSMVNRALELLEIAPTDNVLDLFCGLGNFSLPLATKAANVVGIEGCEKMVARAGANAALNQLDNTEFYCTDLFKELPSQAWVQRKFAKILIDPPRSGAVEIIREIKCFGAQRIVYVSCNPATLARDAGELKALGYHLTQAGVMDMFPHTTHVESIAVFDYKG